MSSAQRLLAAYIEEHRREGDADPLAFLDRASPDDRDELAALIDAYLARAPRREFDEAKYRDSASEQTVDALQRAITGSSGIWPVLLPRLRERAGLKRRELVRGLAEALGVGSKTDKVERYYHEMEQGMLPARGVSDRVLEALASLVGSTARGLREAGQRLAAGVEWEGAADHAFARMANAEAHAYSAPAPRPAEEQEAWDDVDELFRGGS